MEQKKKRAELTLSKFHKLSTPNNEISNNNNFSTPMTNAPTSEQTGEDSLSSKQMQPVDEPVKWNSAPLVPETDDIPF